MVKEHLRIILLHLWPDLSVDLEVVQKYKFRLKIMFLYYFSFYKHVQSPPQIIDIICNN